MSMNLKVIECFRKKVCLVGVEPSRERHKSDGFSAVSGVRQFLEVFTRYNALASQDICTLQNSAPPPTRTTIVGRFHRYLEQLSPTDCLLFYFSGPAIMHQNKAYLLPSDFDPNLPVPVTALPVHWLSDILVKTKQKNAALLFDLFPWQDSEEVGSSGAGQHLLGSILADTDIPGVETLATYAHPSYALQADQLLPLARACKKIADVNQHISLHYLTTEILKREPNSIEGNGHTQDGVIAWRALSNVLLFPITGKSRSQIRSQSDLSPIYKVFPAPVRRAKDFFDRKGELKNVLEHLGMGARRPIVLQGERGVGKTSFMMRVSVSLDDNSVGDFHWQRFSIEPGMIQDVYTFAREMWDGLMGILAKADMNVIVNEPSFENHRFTLNGFIAAVESAIEQALLQDPFLGIAIMMDELDRSGMEDDKLGSILSAIHYLVEQSDLPIFFLLSIIKPETPKPKWGSPLPTQTIPLRHFDKTATVTMTEALTQAQQWPYSISLLSDWVWEHSGGHPFIAKLLLTAVHENQHRAWQPDVLLQSVLQIPDASRFFLDVYKRFLDDEEQTVMLVLASTHSGRLAVGEVERWPTTYRRAARRLVNRGYWTLDADGYGFQSHIWRLWLRQWPDFDFEYKHHQIPVTFPSSTLPPGICIVASTQRVYVDGEEMGPFTRSMFRALFYLAQHVGEVVNKDELGRAMYPEEQYVGSDASLNSVIYRIRKALGDTKPYHFLHTVHNRGFRLEKAIILER